MIKLNVLVMFLYRPKSFGSFTFHQLDPGRHSGALLNTIAGWVDCFLPNGKINLIRTQ